jgi:hypothetical protein
MSYQESNWIESSTPQKPALPIRTGRQGILKTLDHLGFAIPSEIVALAASGTAPLGSLGFTLDVYTLDQAFKKFDVKVSDRIMIKADLSRQGLLK